MIKTRKVVLTKPAPVIYLIAIVIALMIVSNGANVIASVSQDEAVLNPGFQ